MDNKAFFRTLYGSILGCFLGIAIGLFVHGYYKTYRHYDWPTINVIIFGFIGALVIMIVQWFMTIKKETVDKLQKDLDNKVGRDEFNSITDTIRDEFHETLANMNGIQRQVNFIYKWVKHSQNIDDDFENDLMQ